MKVIRHLGSLLKGHFFAGLLVLVPLGVISWIVVAVLQILWGLHNWVPEGLRPESYIDDPNLAALAHFALTVGGAVLVAFAVSFLGWGSKQFLGKKIFAWISEIIQHIPLIRSVYSALDQLLRTLASGGGQQFNRVVYIEYPRKGVWALAFVTGPARGVGVPENHLNVYVPTTPNPTSGFHLIVAESEVRESHLKVEEAFKTILSLGIAQNG